MKRKISSSKSKDGYRYPVLKLSKDWDWLIGKEVEVEATYVGGRLAVIAFVDAPQVAPPVAQLDENPAPEKDRISFLEERLARLERFLRSRVGYGFQSPERQLWWARGASNPGPPPCKGGVITSLDHGPARNRKRDGGYKIFYFPSTPLRTFTARPVWKTLSSSPFSRV